MNEQAKIAQERTEQRGGKPVVVARRELTVEEQLADLRRRVEALENKANGRP